jgi:putative membrane protein
MMRILVLNVDRDDDFGQKAGLNSPFIGRQENLEASIALGIKDPEDSDTNTLLAAIGMYDEMVKKGMDAEVATICGDMKVGYESDLVLATQLENVLEVIKPDRVVLVSDGAEDEYIFPMVASRVKVDSVRRVFVKQAPTVEGTYYILTKMLQDDKIRKRILPPIGLVLAVFGFFALLPKVVEYMSTPDLGLISDMALGVIGILLGLYLIFYAYKVGERVSRSFKSAARAVRSGSLMIVFAALAAVFLLAGITNGIDAAASATNGDITLQLLLFISGALWFWMFAAFSYATGKFVSMFFATAKVYWTYIVVTLTVFAIGFIVQGAVDSAELFLGYNTFSDLLIVLEILTGFLLAVFGGVLNASMRVQAARTVAVPVEETPEAAETSN